MELTIGEVAKQAGVATSAIRYYEKQQLIESSGRRSGQRRFEETVLDRLAIISLAKNAGFTIVETRQLLSGFKKSTKPNVRWQSLASTKLVELDRRIEEAERMKEVLKLATGCECSTLERCGQALRRKKTRPNPA